MTNTNNMDLDLFERLCLTKTFDELSQEERQFVLRMVTEAEYNVMYEVYQTMQRGCPDEIVPSSILKDKLDEALHAKKCRKGIFQLRMPVYQSAAAAVIFFLAGFGFNLIRDKPEKLACRTTEVVKYVDRPVKQIQYVTLPARKEQNQVSQPQSEAKTAHAEEIHGKNEVLPESNSDIMRQHAIALADVNPASNDTNGVSMENDTVLKKMVVTMY